MLILVAMALVLPGTGFAMPDPPPPGDYPGTQYIDRSGCVFALMDDLWQLRRDKDGAAVCGFPPSQAAMDVGTIERPSAENILMAAFAEGLRPGDLLTDEPTAPLNDVPAEPAQATLDREVAQQLAAEGRMRGMISGPAPIGLCARLGYRPVENAGPGTGRDVTGGLCHGMYASEPQVMIRHGGDEDELAGPSVKSVNLDRTQDRRETAKPNIPRRTVPAQRERSTAGSVIKKVASSHTAPKPAGVEMIPATARYVQIGIYPDDDMAAVALQRLSRLGYPAAQRHERIGAGKGKAILAGPFNGRQDLIEALSRLRSGGYPKAIAR